MRSSPKNKDWQNHSPDPHPDEDQAPPAGRQDHPAHAEPEAGRKLAAHAAEPGKAGRQAAQKKKIEDLNDREDLSDRTFSDRNWL
jgi:hypothetical protein